MKTCKWCDKNFETSISYQIYCSEECRELATKEKIAIRYVQTRRQKRKGKDRRCKKCGQKLSIYNDESLCAQCIINPNDVKKAIKEMKGLFNDSK
jgi:ribosomal protein S14